MNLVTKDDGTFETASVGAYRVNVMRDGDDMALILILGACRGAVSGVTFH